MWDFQFQRCRSMGPGVREAQAESDHFRLLHSHGRIFALFANGIGGRGAAWRSPRSSAR